MILYHNWIIKFLARAAGTPFKPLRKVLVIKKFQCVPNEALKVEILRYLSHLLWIQIHGLNLIFYHLFLLK